MPIPNQTALVTDVKDDCITRDIIPVPQEDNGDAAQITWRVAWELKSQGALLIKKSSGQNGWVAEDGPYVGQKFSHDSLQFADGFADCLVGAGPPDNVNQPAWQWTDGPPPAPGSCVVPWDLDADLEPEPEPEPIPPVIEPMPPMPTVWSEAEFLSLEWFTDMSPALDAVYCNLFTAPGQPLRHADYGGWGNWQFHIVVGEQSVDWVVAEMKKSDEYHAAHPEG
jgi:hypothetical protein